MVVVVHRHDDPEEAAQLWHLYLPVVSTVDIIAPRRRDAQRLRYPTEKSAATKVSSLRPGDTVHTFGHPGGSSDVIWSEGRFLDRVELKRQTFLFSNNNCRPGSSGGPLLDKDGRLVGIVMATRYFESRTGDARQYRDCISVTEATARALIGKPLFPIALAPAQYFPNY